MFVFSLLTLSSLNNPALYHHFSSSSSRICFVFFISLDFDDLCGGEMQEQQGANSFPSSSERSSSSAAQHVEIKEGMESDDEIRRVPEFGGEVAGTSASGTVANSERVQPSGDGQRKRGKSVADKENKRLKRLLRNRVSAQQARERKKAYLGELEVRVKDLEKKNSELEERVSTLQNENQMLRHILKNTTASKRGASNSSNNNADGST